MGAPFENAEGPPPGADRRAHPRWRVRSLVYVEPEPGNGGIVLDVSEGGVSVQAVGGLVGNELGSMRLQMPGGRGWVDAPARVVWARNSRRLAGLQFATMSDEARRRIGAWLAELGELRTEAPAPASASGGETPATNASEPAASPAEHAPQAILPIPAPAAMAARHDFGWLSGEQLISRKPRREILLAVVAAALALVSLAVGWAAGRGDVRRILARISGYAAQRSERPARNPVAAPP